jgi:phosphatidylglycerophosphate synthase
MIETVKDLRKICEKTPPMKRGPIKKFYNKISLYLVKVILYTKITANQISSLGIVFGGFSAIFYSFGLNISLILGVLFLNLWRLMDSCDGKVARYKGTTSGIGGNLDWLNIRLVPHMVFSGLGIGIMVRSGLVFPIIIGLLVSFLWFITHTFHGVRRQFNDLLEKLNCKNVDNNLLSLLRKKRKILIIFGKAFKVELTKGMRSKKDIFYKIGDSDYISVIITLFTIVEIFSVLLLNKYHGFFLIISLFYFQIIYILGFITVHIK